MYIDGPGDNDGFIVNLPQRMGWDRTVRASDFYGNTPPDLETLAENTGARDYQPCGHAETFRKHDGSCGACTYAAWFAANHTAS